jgi:hypothetical protein
MNYFTTVLVHYSILNLQYNSFLSEGSLVPSANLYFPSSSQIHTYYFTVCLLSLTQLMLELFLLLLHRILTQYTTLHSVLYLGIITQAAKYTYNTI